MRLTSVVVSEPLLAVKGVSKSFKTVTAVDDLSFSVEPGQIFALLGPNGAGKSTTVRMLCGITVPDEGRIEYSFADRKHTHEDVPQQKLGYLPEERGLYVDKSLLDNLTYFASLRGDPPREAKPRALAWLERFGLTQRAGDKVSSLSKGNQQKVQFIAAILHRPQLAILDEPFSGFDPVNQDLVLNMIRELRDEGVTIILSAHQMDLVETLADRIMLMHEGRDVLSGTMGEIRSRTDLGHRLNFTFQPGDTEPQETLVGIDGVGRVLAVTEDSARIEVQPGIAVGEVLHRLTEQFIITDVRSEVPTLREIYLHTVGASPAVFDEDQEAA